MPKKTSDLQILDVTLRDGSYAINYQFTPAQISKIVSSLDAAGIHYIEVNHGCGLGAHENLGLPAAASDREYAAAARNASKRAKIGVIAGPAPVTLEKDIDAVIEKVDFIRFAANCHSPRSVEQHISYARKRKPKLAIFLQLMRSTRRPLPDIIEAARQAEGMGVDTLYLVDTAGHFLPEEVTRTIQALKAKVQIGVGFHGHNNLGLAIANTLAAAAAGADAVDASLCGIGRAGGNAQLEALISLLKRDGRARKIDLDLLLDAGERLIMPIMPPACGIAAIDVLTADANIDLYPLGFYHQIAKRAGITLKEFIRLLGKDHSFVEVGIGEIGRALRKKKIDGAKVLASLGLPQK